MAASGRSVQTWVIREAQHRLPEIVRTWNEQSIEATVVQTPPDSDRGCDFILDAGGVRFAVQCKARGDASQTWLAAAQLRSRRVDGEGPAIPLVVVPCMGDVGRKICSEAGVSWLDLSGNAHIQGPGLLVHIEGRLNRYRRRGRPANPFAPRSSRVARWLLLNYPAGLPQQEIALRSSLGKGMVSTVVRRLQADGLVERDGRGAVRASDPGRLLDAWREKYDFSKHDVVRGHVPARSGEDLLGRLAQSLAKGPAQFAATGLAGAWLIDGFASFRITTLYIDKPLPRESLAQIGFREETRAANVWLVVPNDEAVFEGRSDRHGVPCVHPMQVYLDLKAHPERAAEAASHLRSSCPPW